MFKWLKKLSDKKEEKLEEIDHKQDANGLIVGMYCPVCGYMEVNMDSCELPMEGFAICPNCGDYLKKGNFVKKENGFTLVKETYKPAKRVSGGHYRVRRPGPSRVRSKAGRVARFR